MTTNYDNKPKVPQVLIDFYNYENEFQRSILEWFNLVTGDFSSTFERIGEVAEWLDFASNRSVDLIIEREFAFIKLITEGVDAVDIEPDKQYIVKILGLGTNECYLRRHERNNSWFFGALFQDDKSLLKHTKNELESSGFSDVFDNPMFEVMEDEWRHLDNNIEKFIDNGATTELENKKPEQEFEKTL